MLSLSLQKVTLGYNHQAVVQGVNFEVKQGEMLGIIGPNGSGKSTLIKGISRTLLPISGKILLNGENILSFNRQELARIVAVVPQNPLLPEAFTAFELVTMGRTPHLGLFRFESEKDLNTVRKAMEVTYTVGFAERRISDLSGGERQRLVIARALAQEPKVILLDEPTAHLDINHQIEILNLIYRLCHEEKLITIIALHDLNLAAQYCNRLILLSNGRIFCEGTPEEVIESENIRKVYGAQVCVYPHPVNALPVTLVASTKNKNSLG